MLLPPTGVKTVKLFSKKKTPVHLSVQSGEKRLRENIPFGAFENASAQHRSTLELYCALRESVPVIDAAVTKLTRLLGTFQVRVEDKRFEDTLESFVKGVRTSAGTEGLHNFVYSYFDQLLTYGYAVGEMVPRGDLRGLWGLYNASLYDVVVKASESPLDLTVCRRDTNETPVENQSLMLCTLLSPTPGRAEGNSILKGLPFVSSVLLKIFQSIGQNWERAGNIRYAVTCKPPQNGSVSASHRAKEIAKEWSKTMRSEGGVCDFVSVGDVSVKVIGADSQVLDCDIPVKHLLEQIVSKLSIPPFLLGLSWSSTERMSTVQADILTSELEYYRTLITPVIEKICNTHLKLTGCLSPAKVEWSNISLQDERELAQARLDNARAQLYEEKREVSI